MYSSAATALNNVSCKPTEHTRHVPSARASSGRHCGRWLRAHKVRTPSPLLTNRDVLSRAIDFSESR
jgi:hypothetical protein